MLKQLRERKERDAFECLRIEDSGTKGMDYVPVDQDTKHNSKFLAFMRSLGVHSEQENGGGSSFGFGKAAYFGLSPFATVLTSTCSIGDNGEPKYYFEGTSWLSTHYYDVNEPAPLSFFGRPSCIRSSCIRTLLTVYVPRL